MQIVFEPSLLIGDSSIQWSNVWDFMPLDTIKNGLNVHSLRGNFIFIEPKDTLSLKLKINKKSFNRTIYYYHSIYGKSNWYFGSLLLSDITKEYRKNKKVVQLDITETLSEIFEK